MKRALPIIFKRPAKLVVEFPEITKEENSENSAKINPDWVDAEWEIEFRLAPGVVHCGEPPLARLSPGDSGMNGKEVVLRTVKGKSGNYTVESLKNTTEICIGATNFAVGATITHAQLIELLAMPTCVTFDIFILSATA